MHKNQFQHFNVIVFVYVPSTSIFILIFNQFQHVFVYHMFKMNHMATSFKSMKPTTSFNLLMFTLLSMNPRMCFFIHENFALRSLMLH